VRQRSGGRRGSTVDVEWNGRAERARQGAAQHDRRVEQGQWQGGCGCVTCMARGEQGRTRGEHVRVGAGDASRIVVKMKRYLCCHSPRSESLEIQKRVFLGLDV
jgi:hypothetical protein